MKEIFQNELGILSNIKSIKLRDLNLGGVIFSVIIVVINSISNNLIFIPAINTYFNIVLMMLLTLGLVIYSREYVGERDIRSFVLVQNVMLLLNFIIISLFPTSITWLKLFLSVYIMYNYLAFVISYLPKKEFKNSIEKSSE
ncbi:hypothetical protein KHQ82_07895 [Mycoplasmatota bacterium]|nr:hypothetical protein KHQ82_07895 [Mycoplasmatota bacterium]